MLSAVYSQKKIEHVKNHHTDNQRKRNDISQVTYREANQLKGDIKLKNE